MDLVTKIASTSGGSGASSRLQTKSTASSDFSQLIAAGAKNYSSSTGPSAPKKTDSVQNAPKAETTTSVSKASSEETEIRDYERSTGSTEASDKEKLKSKTEEELSVMSSLMSLGNADLSSGQQVQLVTKIIHTESSSEPLVSGSSDKGNIATVSKEDLVPALGSDRSGVSREEAKMAADLAKQMTTTGMTAASSMKDSEADREIASAELADKIKPTLVTQNRVVAQSSPNGTPSSDTFGPTGRPGNGLEATKAQTSEAQTSEAQTPVNPTETTSAQQAAAANAALQNPSNTIPNAQTGIGTGETMTMRTSETTVADDLTNMLGSRFPTQNGNLTIELDPQNLGKITINVSYENKHAAVTIAASNPKTLEMLSQNATAMANILEQKTGQQTTIFIPNSQRADWQQQDMNSNDQQPSENAQQQQAKQQNNHSNQSSQSFLQQMRLGLT